MDKQGFRRKFMGYSVRQVQEALRARKREEEQVLEEKQARLTELRDENLALKKELEYWRSREQDVSAALLDAQSQARQILEQARESADREEAAARKQVSDLRIAAAENRRALEQVASDVMNLANDFVAHVAACSQQLRKAEEEPLRPVRMPSPTRRGGHKAGLIPDTEDAGPGGERSRSYA